MYTDKSERYLKYLLIVLIISILIQVVIPFVNFKKDSVTRNNNDFGKLDSTSLYVIQPSSEQDIIIIGNPEKINVKPKKK